MIKSVLAFIIFILFQGCAPTALTPSVRAKAQEAGAEIIVTQLGCTHPNSAGGVSVYAAFYNIGDKALKYVYIEVEPYNAVHDKQISSVGIKSAVKLKEVGPINSGARSGGVWSCVWYNSTIKYVKISGLILVFMDGSRVTASSDNDLSKYLAPSSRMQESAVKRGPGFFSRMGLEFGIKR
jgi:hypothetical protein